MNTIIKILVVIILFSFWMYFENKNLRIKKYELKSKNLPDSFQNCKIIMLADLHNNVHGEKNQRLLKKIDSQKPDFIIIAGDMLVGNTNPDLSVAKDFLKRLSRKYPIYYANGNHEQRLELYKETCDTSFKEYTQHLKRCGIHLLRNQSTVIKKGKDHIVITGLEIEEEFYRKSKRPIMTAKHIETLLGKKNRDEFNLLIAHNPMYFKQYAEWGADLVLSGHLHGCVMRLPFIGGVISPQLVLFPKYDYGMFREGDSNMIISSGLGTHTIKFRIFNPPEIVVICMKNS